MKYIVTGGAGFIGHHLVNKLIENNNEVIVIDDLSTGKVENINKKVQFIKHDIRNEFNYEFNDVDAVFHLASCTSIPESFEDPEKYRSIIYDGTKNILEIAVNNKIPKLIFSSSAAVYGEAKKIPISEDDTKQLLSAYAKWKYEAERLITDYHKKGKINGIILRYFNVYGKGQPSEGSYAPAVARFLDQKIKGQSVTVTGDGLQTRDYVYVGDVAKANINATTGDFENCEVFNIASGKEYVILDIAKAISESIVFIEPRNEVKRSCANINKVNKLMQWKPSQDLFKWIKKPPANTGVF